ncbi:MAG: hypothetical protein ABEN55_08700, partial [Bradymonadaceae bacterium]
MTIEQIDPSCIASDRARVRNLTSDSVPDRIDIHRIDIDGEQFAVRDGTGRRDDYRYWLLRDTDGAPDIVVRTVYGRRNRHYGADPWYIDALQDARATTEHGVLVHSDPGFFRQSPTHQLTDHREILTEYMRRCL